MSPIEFCFWLKGYFELAKNPSLDRYQSDIIRRHLKMVFISKENPVQLNDFTVNIPENPVSC